MPNPSTCGLFFTVREELVPVPLTSVSAKATVIHCVGHVELKQVYENKERDPIEVTYFFPTDPLGAVTSFVADIDGRKLKGIVKPNAEAEQEYDEAVKAGRVALLGSEITGDIFKLQLGNLRPDATATITICYTTEVKNDPDSYSIRFILPTTIAPRYIPPSSTGRTTENLALIEYSSASNPLTISIAVSVSIQGEIGEVKSLSGHSIRIDSNENDLCNPGWGMTVVTLTTTEMDRDFVLLVTPKEALMSPRIYSEVLDESTCYMLHIIPSFAVRKMKAEFILLVDRSGSMGGSSIKLAADALSLFLHSLPVDCYFNIIGFGSTFEQLFPESRKYGEEALQIAREYCSSLKANMGGTEILSPLQHIYTRMPQTKGYLRQLFLLTDGEVGNTDEVISLVKENAWNSRVFSIGVGSSCCRELIEGVARAGEGTAAFVERNESIRTATMSQLKNAIQPALQDVKIEWIGLPSESSFLQSPSKVPPVFDGSQLIVFGIFERNTYKPTGVKISADSPDGPLTFTVEIQTNHRIATKVGKTDVLHTLGWIKQARELELLQDSCSFPDWKDEIVQTSVKNGFATKYTSFIIIDESNPEASLMRACLKRQVPQSLPYLPISDMDLDYRSVKDFSLDRVESQLEVVDRVDVRAKSRKPWKPSFKDRLLRKLKGEKSMSKESLDRRSTSSHSQFKSEERDQDVVLKLCTSQNFDGSFSLDVVINAIVKKAQALHLDLQPECDTKVFATLLVIEFLRVAFSEKQDLWELIVAKAKEWLATQSTNQEMKDKVRDITNLLTIH